MTCNSAKVGKRAGIRLSAADVIFVLSMKVLASSFLPPIFLGAPLSAYAQNAARIEAVIPVRPEFTKYADLFAAPSYALVALDNIGASPLTGGRITIQDAASFRYRVVEARFTGRKDAVYRYEGKIEWNLAVTTAALSGVMELDTARLADGTVALKVSFPLAGLLPEELVERIRAKLALIGEPKRQDALLAYLAALQQRIDAAPAPKPTLFELILIDAHNQSIATGSTVREPGDAEPLSDQMFFIVTLAIWFVLVPAALIWRRRWLRRRSGKTS